LTDPKENAVTPGYFFNALRNHLPQDTVIVVDNGTHRFYAAELFPVSGSRLFICPSDSNCMGYGIPAAIGTKMLNKSRIVVAIISESDLLLNGFELITAHHYKSGIMVFVIRDLDSSLIPSIDERTRHKSKEVYEQLYINIEKFSECIRSEYFLMKNDIDISGVLTKSKDALKAGKNAVVEVIWDSSRKALFTEALYKPDLSRIGFAEKIKMLFKGGQ
jgi:acetolactate synthase-1/2/3 large subunit